MGSGHPNTTILPVNFYVFTGQLMRVSRKAYSDLLHMTGPKRIDDSGQMVLESPSFFWLCADILD